MSDSENEATVLGKRDRDEQNATLAADASAYDDQSDEDVGPMPMPSDANTAVKKKRKGAYFMPTPVLDPSLNLNQSFHTKSYTSNIFQMQTNITSLSCTETRSTFAS